MSQEFKAIEVFPSIAEELATNGYVLLKKIDLINYNKIDSKEYCLEKNRYELTISDNYFLIIDKKWGIYEG